MEQLKMYRLPGAPLPPFTLPAGCAVVSYQGPQDRQPWLDCCRAGLIPDDAGMEAFENTILRHADLIPERDVLFLDIAGRRAATITPVYHPDSGRGEIHMVSVHRDYRGRGLGNGLMALALRALAPREPRLIYLTTDDWRLPAIKSYLSAGFLPVIYGEGDKIDRWRAALQKLGVEQANALNDAGEAWGVIRAAE